MMDSTIWWQSWCADGQSAPENIPQGHGFFLSDSYVRGVTHGVVNLFLGSFDRHSGALRGTYHFVCALEAGSLLFPVSVRVEDDEVFHRLLVMPLPGAQLRQSHTDWLTMLRDDERVVHEFESFVRQLLTPLAAGVADANTDVLTAADIAAHSERSYATGASFRPGQGLVWVHVREGFCSINGGEEQLLLAPGAEFPLTPQTWLHCPEDAAVSVRTTSAVVHDVDAEVRVNAAMLLSMRAILLTAAYRRHERVRRVHRLVEHEQDALRSSWRQLQDIVIQHEKGQGVGPDNSAPLLHGALERAATACGMCVTLPNMPQPSSTSASASSTMPDTRNFITETTAFLESCGVFHRVIDLHGTWWREAGPPILGFLGPERSPVALSYTGGAWSCFDPRSGQSRRVRVDVAAALAPEAVAIYPRLPSRPLGVRDVLALTFSGVRNNAWVLMLLAVLGGVMGSIPAALTGIVFNVIIPTSDTLYLLQAGCILGAVAFSFALLKLFRAIMSIHLSTWSSHQLQTALWGRLLTLPPAFFAHYTAGDLADRIMGVESMREDLGDAGLSVVIKLVVAVPNVAVMLYFNPLMAMVAVGAVALYATALAWIGYLNLSNRRQEQAVDGNLAGLGLQLLRGIAKIRMSLSEDRAFVRWSSLFAEKLRWQSRSLGNAHLLAMLNVAFAPLVTAIFFLIIGSSWWTTVLNMGEYLAFSAAFAVLAAACSDFAQTVPVFLSAMGQYQRLRPILDAIPEIQDIQAPAGEINGRVEMRQVLFRYQPGGPLVLRDVTICAEPGEFVAIVGSSGAGKSTIAKLLLGFDRPESGGIFYGDIDLATVNVRELRKQIGVVLQGGGLIQGSIYENIAGASGMSLDAAWEAARLAGVAEDIQAMPMGMHTLLHDGAISGGQQQRILIARALARKPKLLIFDEATSALDNETQAHVSNSLERLNATRIVIAHRLSTIERADRIYVLDQGRVVQTGSFAELIATPGLFQHLAQRQML